MKIMGVSLKFSRQLNGGRENRGKRGYFAKDKSVVVFDDENFGDSVQAGFARLKERVCKSLNIAVN